jgi:hypothetical protein
MAELDSYSALTTAIGTWEDRTFTSTETDQFIRLVEAKADRKLKADFRRRTSATINTDASGTGTLPTGFVGMTSLVRDVLGSVPLKQVSWDAMISRNPYEISDDGQVYAINGTTIQIAPVTDDNYLAKFSSVLTGLSGAATTNWLLALAPDYYLFGCQAAAAAKWKSYQEAAMLNAMADDILNDLVSQGNVAEYGNAEMTLDMVTP